MIEIRELTKRYGSVVAVDQLTFQAHPGAVTGFLGPNGAGKSTTMRMLVGLDHPTSGAALVEGRPYTELDRPMHHVGALLGADAMHPDRTGFAHVHALARSNGIGRRRVTAVLDRVGLDRVADRRVRGYSLGMRQRLGVAVALLGDPAVLLFDEPANGLDPEGIQWVRALMRGLAAEGRTVLVSSHVMSEMELTVDAVVVIGRGRLLATTTAADLAQRFARDVYVRTPDAGRLAALLSREGAQVAREPGGLSVHGVDAARVGEVAAAHALPLHELVQRRASLEDVYLELTAEATEYRTKEAAA